MFADFHGLDNPIMADFNTELGRRADSQLSRASTPLVIKPRNNMKDVMTYVLCK